MSNCPTCGSKLEDLGKTGRGICPNCGILELTTYPISDESTQTKRCMFCGEKIPPQSDTCTFCGFSQIELI